MHEKNTGEKSMVVATTVALMAGLLVVDQVKGPSAVRVSVNCLNSTLDDDKDTATYLAADTAAFQFTDRGQVAAQAYLDVRDGAYIVNDESPTPAWDGETILSVGQAVVKVGAPDPNQEYAYRSSGNRVTLTLICAGTDPADLPNYNLQPSTVRNKDGVVRMS